MFCFLVEKLSLSVYRQTPFYCASLNWAWQILCFYKLRVRGDPAWSKSFGTIFPNSICLLHVSVTRFGDSPNISNFLIIITFVMEIHDQ